MEEKEEYSKYLISHRSCNVIINYPQKCFPKYMPRMASNTEKWLSSDVCRRPFSVLKFYFIHITCSVWPFGLLLCWSESSCVVGADGTAHCKRTVVEPLLFFFSLGRLALPHVSSCRSSTSKGVCCEMNECPLVLAYILIFSRCRPRSGQYDLHVNIYRLLSRKNIAWNEWVGIFLPYYKWCYVSLNFYSIIILYARCCLSYIHIKIYIYFFLV